ncbi:MAG: hypothetical protein M1821_001752 [Bathelium mastoideum]|nr:MAG: hypothetical protein M1821_001752 [Bathelium mastoideum]
MAAIRNVAVVGASGSLGAPVLEALINSGKFNVTVVRRPSSTATYPESIKVTTADLSSVDSVTAAFEGQDAVVSTVGTAGVPTQSVLVEAAVGADVKRFLPSDFGCDMSNPKAGALPVYKNKMAIHKQLREAAAARPSFTWTSVCSNAFLDYGLQKNFLLNWKESKPKFFDGGKKIFSATSLDSIGQAVVGVLSHPEETENRFVYVKDIDVSQNQLLEIAKRVDPGKKWEEPVHVSTAELEKSSNESLAKGQVSPPVMMAYLFRVIFGPPEYGGYFAKVDNALLGVKGKTEADVEAFLRKFMLS